MQWMKRAWRGEEKLWKAFWYSVGLVSLVGAIFGGFVGVVGVTTYKDQLLHFAPPTTTTGPSLPAVVWWQLVSAEAFSFLVAIPLSIWQAIIVWRCSFNVQSRARGYLARIIIVLSCSWGAVDTVHVLSYFPAIMGNKSALFKETCQLDMGTYIEWLRDGKKVTEQYIDEHPFDLKGCIQSLAASAEKP